LPGENNVIADTLSRLLHTHQPKEYTNKITLPTNLDVSAIETLNKNKEAAIKKIH
jgi:hypothetical protein